MGFLTPIFEPAKQALGQVVSAAGLLRPTEEEKKSEAKTLSRQESDISILFSGSSSGPGSSEGSDSTYSRSVSKDFPEEGKITQSLASQQEEVRMLFNSVDADGDGKICRKELTQFLANLKLDKGVSEVEIQGLLEAADENGDDLLEFEEFFNLYLSLQAGATEDDTEELESEEGVQEGEQGLRDAFRVFDQNNDGFISASELLLVLQSLNIKSTKKLADCSHMIKAVDKDGDGKVNFEEFKHMMANGLQ